MPKVGPSNQFDKNDPERQKRIEAAAAKINKEFPGTLIRANESDGPTPRITSGSLGLDVSLGGGWPAHHWIEIWGKESTGKTAVCLKTLAANQKLDPDWTCLWIAAEDFDPGHARLCGVDLARVFVFNNNVMEDVYQVILEQLKAGDFDMIVLDSLPALVPLREDAENDVTDVEPGLGARRTNSFLRRAGKAADRRAVLQGEKRPTTVFIINQPRVMIGGFARYGVPTTTPGGEMKNYACSIRVELSRMEMLKDGDVPVGQKIKATVRKNKTHPPLKAATFDFYFDDYEDHDAGSYDTLQEIVDIGIAMGIIGRKGAWYTYQGEQWNGKDKGLIPALRADKELQKTISNEVLLAIRTDPDRYNVKDSGSED